MANEALDAFLKEGAEAASEPAPAAPEPAAAPTTGEPEAKAAPSKATPEADADDADPGDRVEQNGKSYIPQPVLERERQRRQDWKERALRHEERAAALEKQLEDAKRAAQPPPQYVPPPAPINPAEDPGGFVAQVQQVVLNERLNNSEMFLREKIGSDKVDEYVAEFKQIAQNDPALFNKLYSQPNPYSWMQREVDRQRMLRDVGDDPAAYRAKIEAEARTKWEAEAAQRAPAPSPAVGMQPSLATARSVAGRSAPTWTGEPSLEDVLAPVQNRKSQNGQMRRF
jgi:hypothetical protein